MGIREHIHNTLHLTPAISPWPRMLLCGIATGLPLLVGYFQNQLGVAIFGALASFLLILNDNLGPLWRRLYNFTLTFAILSLGLEIGIRLEGHPRIFMLALLAMSYFIGLMDAQNSEFERAILFATFQMLAGFASPAIEKHLGGIFIYATLGYLITMLTVIMFVAIYGQTPKPFLRYRDTIRSTLTRDRSRHFYALTYALTVLATLFLVNYFAVDHGYWAVGTVLITMRPDSILSIYRSIQRLFGTLLGVILAGLLIYYIRDPLILIAFVFIVSVWTPWSLAKNYWLGSGFLAVIILILLDLPFAADGNLQTPFLRLQATAIGCGCTILAILGSQLHKKWAKLIFR